MSYFVIIVIVVVLFVIVVVVVYCCNVRWRLSTSYCICTETEAWKRCVHAVLLSIP